MTNPTYQAFVDAIIAEPHDETHRLVCSDWLEDQGHLTDAEKFRSLPLTAALWSSDWGQDQFGLWVTLQVESAKQRLRWIEPGKFMMGSPEDEEWRADNEGPQHEVEISRGFWMFDTPCTQGLWQTVMGDNPSRTKGENRPVETVSWDDVQAFIEKLNGEVVGLGLELPTEAQWEYACRAGTTTARYSEDLDRIAWHYENSGNEAHPVGEKEPNEWGLYDMLGNVWEWCADGMRRYSEVCEIDPVGPVEAGSRRVVRGGSFAFVVQRARAALHIVNSSGSRLRSKGFRCASSGN